MRRLCALLVIAVFVGLVALSAPAVAERLVGGSVDIGSDETVGDTTATGGTIVVEGTVDGDLKAYGSDVTIADGAEVTGIVRAYGGSVTIDGSVGGNALAYGGAVRVGETADIDRSFGAVAGEVRLAGRIGGDASAVAGDVTLAETASISGNLNHVGELHDAGGTVDGVIQDGNDLALSPPTEVLTAGFGVAMFVGNLLVGAVLLRTAPRFADSAAGTVRTDPVYTAAVGLAAALGTLGGVAVLAVTIIGLPLAVGLLLAFLPLAWVGNVYGQYAVGAAALSPTGYENRYLGLVVGVLVVTLLGFVPYLGTLVSIAVFGLGAGVVVFALQSLRRLISEHPGGLAGT